MKCWECENFKILYEPLGKISTGLWDMGKAKCMKHDGLYVEFADHKKLMKLNCIEETRPELLRTYECPLQNDSKNR